jgi:putative transposase
LCADCVTTPALDDLNRHGVFVGNKLRFQEVGRIYHVNTKCVAGVKAFPDFRHRAVFMEMLGKELEDSDWICLGYAIVGNHYHVAIRLKKLTLSSGFQRLNSRYARWYNRQHGRTGAFWQRRFYDSVVETDGHLLELQRYLAYNAPRANLAETPEDWPYCSYGALIGVHPPDPWVDEDEVLSAFGPNLRRARERLRRFVEERDPRVRRQTILRARSDAKK